MRQKPKGPTDTPLLLGAHLSIAGGLHHAATKAKECGCTALQIFTKNATNWKERDVTTEEIGQFSSAIRNSDVRIVTAHAAYLINLASPDETIYERSVAALENEMHRSHRLGISHVIVHPGAHKNMGQAWGLERIAAGIVRILDGTPDVTCRLLLETTAGQGTSLGCRFEHLGAIMASVNAPERTGICLDTSHIFSAGYDLRTREAYDKTMAALDETIGLEHLYCLHVNDSKKALASRVDRHEHIGKGNIGVDAFRFIMNDPRLRNIPKIIETPKKEGEIDCDPINLALLRSLVSRK